MAKIKAHAGDFGTGNIDFNGKYFSFLSPGDWSKTHVPAELLTSIDSVNHTKARKNLLVP